MRRLACALLLVAGGCDARESDQADAYVVEAKADRLLLNFQRHPNVIKGSFPGVQAGQNIRVRFKRESLGNGLYRYEILEVLR